jgi:phospholipid transport system substrate-binding protein
MMRFLSMSTIAVTLAAAYVAPALADAAVQSSPIEQIKKVADEVLTEIKKDPSYQSDPTKLQAMVSAHIAPHFDFTRLTQMAIARHWRVASPEQKKELTEQFSRLLVRTYSNALVSYRNQDIEYLPLRNSQPDQDVVVRTRVHGGGKSPIAVDFTLYSGKNGWKAYDVSVAGVSLVTNYRDEFNATIRDKGIDGLIQLLKDKNNKPLSTKSS